ncbi:MAG: ABC transporter ATP-binding protein [Anaerolineae bacterium]
MLAVEGVSVFHGHVQAVRRVSLRVEPGEIVALVGANGAGKSSLLRAIAGLQPAAQGRITWAGARLDGLPPYRVARAGLALIPEGRQILAPMSVRDNLLLGAYMPLTGAAPGNCTDAGGVSRWKGLRNLLAAPAGLLREQAVCERLQGVYRLFPILAERQRQLAGSLSGGEQQMLAIGRALMAGPRLLLLDEPSIGLAPNLVREILRLLVTLREEGLTILLVEQDAHAALRIADRGYVMETGRIAVEGSARELLASPQMRRAYLGMA